MDSETKYYQIIPTYIGTVTLVNGEKVYKIDRYITDDILFFKGAEASLDGLLITKNMKNIIQKYNIEPIVIIEPENTRYSYSLKHNIKNSQKKLPVLYGSILQLQIASFKNSQHIFVTPKGKIIITEKMKNILKTECKSKRIKIVDIQSKKEKKQEDDDIVDLKNTSVFVQQKENYLFQFIIMFIICLAIFFFFIR